jgi:hypothetical protein
MITFDVQFNLTPVSKFLSAVGAQTSLIESELADAAHRHWQQLAHQRLRTSKDKYLAALQPPKATSHGTEISLDGDFANMVENGVGAYDLRDTLLQNGQTSRVIAFRFASVGGQIGGTSFTVQPLGWVARAQQAGNPASGGSWSKPEHAAGWRAVGRMIENMFAVHHSLYGSSRFGDQRRGLRGIQRTPPVPSVRRQHAVLQRIDAGARNLYHPGHVPSPILGSRSGYDVYSGMRRQGRLDNGGQPGSGGPRHAYATFRTISRDNATGWFHPGIAPRRLVDQVQAQVDRLAPQFVEAAVIRAARLASGGGTP